MGRRGVDLRELPVIDSARHFEQCGGINPNRN